MRLLSTLTIAVLLFVIWEYHGSVVRYEEILPVLEQRSERFLTSDLTGKTVPPRYLGWLDSQSDPTEDGEGWRAIWIIDAETCLGCLVDVASWNQLAVHDVTPTLVLMGVTEPEAQDLADGARITTSVTSDPRSISRTTFGFELGSLRLLLHPDGTILFVDPRNPAATCFWDFPALVERLTEPSSRTPVVSSGDATLPDAFVLSPS